MRVWEFQNWSRKNLNSTKYCMNIIKCLHFGRSMIDGLIVKSGMSGDLGQE